MMYFCFVYLERTIDYTDIADEAHEKQVKEGGVRNECLESQRYK